MCEICEHDPCIQGCPNADEPRTYGVCADCEEPIIFGSLNAVTDDEGNVFCNDLCLLNHYGCRYINWDLEDDGN